MDLESSVEDDKEVTNVTLFQKAVNNGESDVHINGPYLVENGDDEKNELHGIKGNGTEISRLVGSPLESPSPTVTKKGSGLRKWRRIRREERHGDSSDDTREMVIQDLSNSVANPSKRIQVHADREQKSLDSVSSTKAVVKSLDAFGGPSFDAGTDSDNSEDRSSKSSTAASAPKMKYDFGFQHDKSITRSLSGKNSTPVKKGRIDIIKKARGEQIKIEKENSHSNSSFLFMQGNYGTSNGVTSDRPIDSDEENGDEGHGKDGERVYGNILHEEKSQNHNSSSDQDHLVESIFALQSAQEALEKEVLKFKEIKIDDDSLYGEGVLTQNVQSEAAKATNGDVETELEALFKQKIEAEVEYLAISRTVQKLKVYAMDQITLLEKQKVEQTQILKKLNDTENKADMLLKKDTKSETLCEEIATADETLKLQKRVRKYTSYLIVQLVCLVLVLGVLTFELSMNYVEIVPT